MNTAVYVDPSKTLAHRAITLKRKEELKEKCTFSFERVIKNATFCCAKYGWDRCCNFDNMLVLIFCEYGWKIHALLGFLGI